MQPGKDKVGLLLLRTKQFCLLLFVAPFPPLDVFLPRMMYSLSAVAPKLPKTWLPTQWSACYGGFLIGRGCVLEDADWWKTDKLGVGVGFKSTMKKSRNSSSSIRRLALSSSIHMILRWHILFSVLSIFAVIGLWGCGICCKAAVGIIPPPVVATVPPSGCWTGGQWEVHNKTLLTFLPYVEAPRCCSERSILTAWWFLVWLVTQGFFFLAFFCSACMFPTSSLWLPQTSSDKPKTCYFF